MNQRSDIDRVLSTWMTDGPAAIPDRVVDVVAARIGVQRQRRGWLSPRRTNVTTQIKLIAALAAVLVVAVVGYNLLPGSTGVGAPTTAPTTAPTAGPTTAPTPSPRATAAGAVLPEWYTTSERPTGPGILPAGSHTTRSFRPGFTFSVPNGWVNDTDSDGVFHLFPDTPANKAEFERSGELAQSILMGPHSSPYFACESLERNRGETAAEMVAALVANDFLATTGLVDVEIGGLTGKEFDVRVNPDWTGSCPGDPPGLDLKDMRTRGLLLDAPRVGVLVLFVGSMYSADHEAFVAEAMPIVESFEFDLTQ